MNKKIILIMCFTFLIYVIYAFMAITNQITEFWDSTEYLLLAKHWAKGTPESGFATHREIMPALIWYPFFLLGVDELGIRLFMLFIGLANVYISYLLTKEMYNEKKGLFVACMMSVYYMNIFYMTRLTMYVIAPLMVQTAIYFFWKYLNKKKFRYILISFLIIGLGMTIYYNTAFVLLIIGAFLIITNKKFFKNLDLWKAGVITLLILTPYFIYSIHTYGHPIPRLAAVQKAYAEEAGGGIGLWNAYLKLIPNMLTLPLFLLMIGGLLLTYPVFLGFDQIIKEKTKKNFNDLFLYLWIIIPLILYTMSAIKQGPAGIGVVLPAYLMMIFPAFFILASKSVFFVYHFIKPFEKNVALLVLFLLIIIPGYFQIQLGTTTFFNRLSAFKEIQDAGDYIKGITQPGDVIVSASVPQLTYYSERMVIGMSIDETEEEWRVREIENKPSYLLLTKFEPHPDWVWTYPDKYNMTVVMGFGNDQTNPTAVLFKYNW